MNLRWLMAAVLCGAMWLSLVGSASASDGWFGSSSKPAANGVTTTGTKKSWWPSWTTTKSKPKARSSSKSTWNSLTTGTKKTWNKTTSFLNPFDNPPKASPSTKETAANSSGWFSSNKPEKKPVETVPDWLVQDKPKW